VRLKPACKIDRVKSVDAKQQDTLDLRIVMPFVRLARQRRKHAD